MAKLILSKWCKLFLVMVSIACINISFSSVMAQTNSEMQSLKQQEKRYSSQEIVDSGHRFFGDAASGIATAVENIFSKYGLPNGYVLGEEGSGSFIGGLTYGEGTLYTKNAGDHKIFWQGPSVGFDVGGEGSRLMILVYNLDNVNNVWGRYGGVSGSAYFVAGIGFHVLKRNNVLLVPIRTGVGARLGINIGYLKLTARPTWNPF